MEQRIFILTFSAILIYLSGVNAQDDRWLYVGNNDEVSVYYDNETLKKGDKSIIVTLKFININDDINQYIIYNQEYYRDKDYYKLISITVFPKEGTPYKYNYNEIKEIIPGSFEESAYRIFY